MNEKRIKYKGYYLDVLTIVSVEEDVDDGYIVSIQNEEGEEYWGTPVKDRPWQAERIAYEMIDSGEVEKYEKYYDE